MSSISLKAVSIIIGVFLSISRIPLQTSIPFIPGTLISRIIKSKALSNANCKPVLPSKATLTSKPSSDSPFLINETTKEIILKTNLVLFFYCVFLINIEIIRALGFTFLSETFRNVIKYLPLIIGFVFLNNIKDSYFILDFFIFGFIVISILSSVLLWNFLKKHNLFTEKTLDSLLFENIPGTTLKKELIEKDNYKLLSVSNITKTNNNQHYNFYITPLEVISISLVGPKNYVDLYENLFFNSIKLKELSTNWSTYSPSNGKFSVELPEYHVVHSNDDYRNVEIEAYDVSDKSYYFIF